MRTGLLIPRSRPVAGSAIIGFTRPQTWENLLFERMCNYLACMLTAQTERNVHLLDSYVGQPRPKHCLCGRQVISNFMSATFEMRNAIVINSLVGLGELLW